MSYGVVDDGRDRSAIWMSGEAARSIDCGTPMTTSPSGSERDRLS